VSAPQDPRDLALLLLLLLLLGLSMKKLVVLLLVVVVVVVLLLLPVEVLLACLTLPLLRCWLCLQPAAASHVTSPCISARTD
jgi:hypothetical protein